MLMFMTKNWADFIILVKIEFGRPKSTVIKCAFCLEMKKVHNICKWEQWERCLCWKAFHVSTKCAYIYGCLRCVGRLVSYLCVCVCLCVPQSANPFMSIRCMFSRTKRKKKKRILVLKEKMPVVQRTCNENNVCTFES